MTFLMRKLLKIHNNAKIEVKNNSVDQQWYSYLYYGSPLDIMYALCCVESHDIKLHPFACWI